MTRARPRPGRPARHLVARRAGAGRASSCKRSSASASPWSSRSIFPVLLLCIFGSVFNGDIAPGVTFSQYFVAGMVARGIVNSGFQTLAIAIPSSGTAAG